MSTRGRGYVFGRLERRLVGLSTFAFLLVVVLGCSRRERVSVGPLSPHVLSQAPVPVLPASSKTPRDAAPAPPRPGLALFYSSDLRGRVSAKELPRPLPAGVTLAPLAPRESTGGVARRATLVDRARLDAAAVIQVDAGDFLPLPDDVIGAAAAPTARDLARGGDLVLATLRRLGVDAVTLGERELAPLLGPARQRARVLLARLQAAHVPVVLANLIDRDGHPVFPADKLIDAAGVPVGVFGVTELGDVAKSSLDRTGYTLADASATARATARDLRARGARFVVALVHAAGGGARAAAIVAGMEDIDVAVVGVGHDGAEGAPPASAGVARPRVVSVHGDGIDVGRLDVTFAAQRPPALEDHVLPLTKDVPEQLGVGLLSRVPRIPLIDTNQILADERRHKKLVPLRDLYESWDYGSTRACGYCHAEIVAQWETTDHAHALATLTRAKHDHDPACLGCHTVGFLQPGGTRDIVMSTGQFANVGCETCHGPSAEHVRSVDKKKGTSRQVDASVCLGCHTPDQNVGPFDPLAAMKEILGPKHGMRGSARQAAPSVPTSAAPQTR